MTNLAEKYLKKKLDTIPIGSSMTITPEFLRECIDGRNNQPISELEDFAGDDFAVAFYKSKDVYVLTRMCSAPFPPQLTEEPCMDEGCPQHGTLHFCT